MQNTRSDILDYLNTHPGSSATEMGRFLEMTPANIRYHLAILEKGSLVQVSGQRTAGGAGRPILLYNLTPQILGENTYSMMKAILDSMEESEEYQLLLGRITDHLLDKFQFEQVNRISRYNQAVAFLNEHHYRASWKATPIGPQIELRHCPYRDLAESHPQLCQIDERITSRIFNTPLELAQKREFGINPYSPCIFQTIQPEA